MKEYGGRVHRGIEFVDTSLPASPPDVAFPVEVKLREKATGREFTVWTKHLVGGDGAHSLVRQRGVKATLEGENTDYIWGVIDAVVKTDFPDIRKRCAIHSSTGSIMAIPRERIENNQYLTRLYTQLSTAAPPPSTSTASSSAATQAEQEASYQRALAQRRAITLPIILDQIRSTLSPYSIEIAKVDWWAAYHIGQRVATKFTRSDASSIPRILIMGDACHTHSPKAGQGMNVSMMDAYNLGWKLAHELLGLATPGSLTSTYEPERRKVAKELIDFDNAFASKFSQKIGENGTTHEEFFRVFHTGGGFTSGCGIEYEAGSRVVNGGIEMGGIVDTTLDPDLGRLAVGRRLSNVPVLAFASETPVELHDVLPKNGRWTVIGLVPAGFRSEPVAWKKRLGVLAKGLVEKYVECVEPFVVLGGFEGFEWGDLGEVWRDAWGGNVVADVRGEAWRRWGVREGQGGWVVVRPDGVVAGVWAEGELEGVDRFMDGVLRKREEFRDVVEVGKIGEEGIRARL